MQKERLSHRELGILSSDFNIFQDMLILSTMCRPEFRDGVDQRIVDAGKNPELSDFTVTDVVHQQKYKKEYDYIAFMFGYRILDHLYNYERIFKIDRLAQLERSLCLGFRNVERLIGSAFTFNNLQYKIYLLREWLNKFSMLMQQHEQQLKELEDRFKPKEQS